MGATGHTGSFVLAELLRRGLTPVPCGRTTDLDGAFRDADAVINCAGPFASTAVPVIEAAIRAGIPYLDVTAELEVVTEIFADYAGAGIPIVPAVGFYGGLGDLLATRAMDGWSSADTITIAYALSSWRPTAGTRATGRVSARRRDGGRLLHTGHRLQHRAGDAPRGEWSFPPPIGARPVIGEFTTADSVTIPSHLDTAEIITWMTTNAVDDLRDPDPAGPVAVDATGRSAQTFLVEVVVESGGVRRRVSAAGRDIYAITAPLVVGTALRVLARDREVAGVFAAGAIAEPDLLASLGPELLLLG
jgi:hypothetical protein